MTPNQTFVPRIVASKSTGIIRVYMYMHMDRRMKYKLFTAVYSSAISNVHRIYVYLVETWTARSFLERHRKSFDACTQVFIYNKLLYGKATFKAQLNPVSEFNSRLCCSFRILYVSFRNAYVAIAWMTKWMIATFLAFIGWLFEWNGKMLTYNTI